MMREHKFEGHAGRAFDLRTKSGLRAVVLDRGASLAAVYLPDGTNILLPPGASKAGAFIGRNANRIVGARFGVDGESFRVPANDGTNNLHSGPDGFDAQIWDAEIEGDTLRLRHTSPDGHQGFPGRVEVDLWVSLSDTVLRLDMRATTTAPTPVNLTWHPYWNLNGRGRIDGHDLLVAADHRTSLDAAAPIPVKDTRYDFRKALPLGSVRLDDNYAQVERADLTGAKARLTVTSSLPDMQVYTADALTRPRTGVALEPQFRPDDVNRSQASILRPGEIYDHWIRYDIRPR